MRQFEFKPEHIKRFVRIGGILITARVKFTVAGNGTIASFVRVKV
jgi:hypothetical protein